MLLDDNGMILRGNQMILIHSGLLVLGNYDFFIDSIFQDTRANDGRSMSAWDHAGCYWIVLK